MPRAEAAELAAQVAHLERQVRDYLFILELQSFRKCAGHGADAVLTLMQELPQPVRP